MDIICKIIKILYTLLIALVIFLLYFIVFIFLCPLILLEVFHIKNIGLGFYKKDSDDILNN